MALKESYLFLCFGKSYILDCLDLIYTLRSCEDLRSVNVITLPVEKNHGKNFST